MPWSSPQGHTQKDLTICTENLEHSASGLTGWGMYQGELLGGGKVGRGSSFPITPYPAHTGWSLCGYGPLNPRLGSDLEETQNYGPHQIDVGYKVPRSACP